MPITTTKTVEAIQPKADEEEEEEKTTSDDDGPTSPPSLEEGTTTSVTNSSLLPSPPPDPVTTTTTAFVDGAADDKEEAHMPPSSYNVSFLNGDLIVKLAPDELFTCPPGEHDADQINNKASSEKFLPVKPYFAASLSFAFHLNRKKIDLPRLLEVKNYGTMLIVGLTIKNQRSMELDNPTMTR